MEGRRLQRAGFPGKSEHMTSSIPSPSHTCRRTMGLMNDREKNVQLLIDEDVLKDEYIGCHPCVCTSSLKIRTEDVIERFLPATGHDYKTVHLAGES